MLFAGHSPLAVKQMTIQILILIESYLEGYWANILDLHEMFLQK